MPYTAPESIAFVSQHLPSKIKARIPAPVPAKINIDGTNDSNPVHGGAAGFGNWISEGFYDSLAQTLNFLNANGVTENSQAYDANGNKVIVNPTDCLADCFMAFTTNNITSVDVSFFMNSEVVGRTYQLQRSQDNNTFSDVAGASTTATGANNYTLTDNAPLAGTSYYRIKLCCNAGCTSNDTFTGATDADVLSVQI